MANPRVPGPRIVIGGGIGAGKGVVANHLAGKGVTVIEADRIGHRVLEPEGAAYAAVARRWPMVVVDGHIDRACLAAIVFADADDLTELEAVTHPAIIEQIRALVEESDGPVAVEVPVMLSLPNGWIHLFIDAVEERRVSRAVQRGGDEADVKRRAARQADRREWLAWADHVIENNGTIDELEAKVAAWWEELTADR